MKLLVIADDFTGAAEIAGIGWRFGLPTRLLREPCGDEFAGLTVVDSNSRQLPPSQAGDSVRRFITRFLDQTFDLIYKKIDSALRGPVMAEVDAMARALGRSGALLLPQNPSRGRTIKDGQYCINGVPLHLSEFGRDPEYPASTSNVAELLGHARLPVTIANAACADDVRGWAAKIDDSILPVGGADFFTALLSARIGDSRRAQWNEPMRAPLLLACGSASTQARETASRAAREGIEVLPMPAANAKDRWIAAIATALRTRGRAMMTIDRPIDHSPGAAQQIGAEFTDAVRDVIILSDPSTVLIEGGATAGAVCEAIRWRRFEVEGELAPGVVALRPRDALPSPGESGLTWSGPRVIVKPGSYSWPEPAWSASGNI